MKPSNLKQIGKGAFSKVYRKSEKKVLIKSIDSVKECMSHGWFPTTSLFPTIRQVGRSDCGTYKFYEQKFYSKVKRIIGVLSSFELEFYRCLRQLYTPCRNVKTCQFIEHWHKQFATIPNKFSTKRKHLRSAVDALSDYGFDIQFEISPRNIAIQGDKLVLLDCFFFETKLPYN